MPPTCSEANNAMGRIRAAVREDLRMKFSLRTLVMAGLLPLSMAAQHSEHHPAPSKQKHGMMMGGEMMGKQMMERHHQMQKLVDRLQADLKALENENDLTAIKKQLAEGRALVEQLQANLQQRHEMMQQMMEHMQNCPMVKSVQKQAEQ